MANRRVTVLCTGDIHLGRYPARVPTDEESLSVRHVWSRIVDRALEMEVDLVALTGDVIDRANRYFEALGPFQSGIRRLGEAGIDVVAVAGNHDFDVFTSAADVADDDRFRLLGRGGRWESLRLRGDYGEIRVVGWSYPTQHVLRSPVGDLQLQPDDEVLTIGLLHADLDAPSSRYAPVTSSELGAAGVDLWLLGHIHAARSMELGGTAVALYPGSPQALHPGETGTHGPWIVEVEMGKAPRFRQLPLATVAYRTVEVDLEGVEGDEEFRSAVPLQVLEDLRRVVEGSEGLARVVYRLRYTGRTELHRRLEELSQGLVEDWEEHYDGVVATVDEVESQTAPPIDLEELAGGEDPPALLARALLAIRDGGDDGEAGRLLARVRKALEEVYRGNAYRPLLRGGDSPEEIGDEQVRRVAWEEGLKLLDALREQRAGRGGGGGRER